MRSQYLSPVLINTERELYANSVVKNDIDRTWIYLAVEMGETAISLNVFYKLI